MAMVVLDGLCKSFGDVHVVDHVSLEVEEGEMLCLLGPSGCGKTTLLRLLSGFLQEDAGTISMGGVDVTRLAPEARPTSLVFQNYALFPHLNVFDNVAFGLKVKKLPMKEIRQKVADMLVVVGLEGKDTRAISQLSGGQQQRVALARALVMEPKVLLLDEPLSNLDAKLRLETRGQIRRIQQSVGITSIFVTHDQEEALTMADRVAVMRSGKIEQLATPRDIYYHPGNSFVADFIGKSNFMKGACNQETSEFVFENGQAVAVPMGPPSDAPREEKVYVLRPEAVSIRAGHVDTCAEENILHGAVEEITFLGELTEYRVRLAGGLVMQAHVYGYTQQLQKGDAVSLCWDKGQGQVL